MIALNRRRVMRGGGGGPLPYDAEVEYLQGDGSAYIDTGVLSSGNIDINIGVIDYFNSNELGKWLFGSRRSDRKTANGMYINANDTYLYLAYGNNNLKLGISSDYPTTTNIVIGNRQITIGNISHTYTKSTFSGAFPIYLFALNNAGETLAQCYAKISSCQISNGSQELDLIPVRVGQIGYMYDRISGQLFGNAGSGSFILGPDKN